jgi:hypothetical protein
MKAVRDAMRSLATVPASLNESAPNTPRHAAARDAIYLLYLGLESGRDAIHDLVEFDPERAERTIVVLISELVAYDFLRREFSSEDDMRCKRLRLREPVYRDLIPELHAMVNAGWNRGTDHDWEPAWLLLPELSRRYAKAVPSEQITPPPRSNLSRRRAVAAAQ